MCGVSSSADSDGAGPILFRLVRLLSRWPGGKSVTANERMSSILVVQAVGQGESSHETTIGVVADWLRIAPSTASRLVGVALDAGYVSGSPSAADGRRTVLHLTDKGASLLEWSLEYQHEVFAKATGDWTEEERADFARLLAKFADSVATTEL